MSGFTSAPPPCADDPAMFFSKNPARREQAKRVCAGCPFQEPCRTLSDSPMVLDDSVYTVKNGVWAGVDKADAEDLDALSPKQRQTRDRIVEVKKLLAEGLSGYAIGKRMGLGNGSVRNIISYIKAEEAA